MGLEDILKFLLSAIVGGGVVLLALKTFIIEKIKSSIKHDYDLKLENFKNEISKQNSIINTVLLSHNQGYQDGNAERILSIKLFWINYLKIKNSIYMISLNDSTLLESELNTLYTSEWSGNSVTENEFKQITYDTITKNNEIFIEVEKLRPFLSEELWLNFTFLDKFCGRITLIYKRGSDNRKFVHWKKDVSLYTTVMNNLTSEEFHHIVNLKSDSVKAVLSFIEQKVILELTKITTGQVAADNTYNQALKLIELSKVIDNK